VDEAPVPRSPEPVQYLLGEAQDPPEGQAAPYAGPIWTRDTRAPG
jgi:hypothetical protein